MNEIRCPHCGKAFKIDEASFAAILKQVRDGEFEKELHARIDSEVRAAEAKTKQELQFESNKKDLEIANLKSKLDNVDTETKLAVAEAVKKVEDDRNDIANKLEKASSEYKLSEANLKEKYENIIKFKDEEIAREKDYKAKLSVKLVGENLEQHCQNEFNAVRSSLFPFAYFEKDNKAVKEYGEDKGTKGDFIYKDYDAEGGAEIISIMFEMKDEQDTSANKRTVESHLDKLDKDRKKKGLEYAVLVTLLEADNNLYNRGIVDMSYKYEKMYVIRPQFFLPLITLLKSASMKAAEAKRQLMVVQSQNVDITNFESDVNNWKDSWLRIMKNAGKKHLEGVEQINKAIKDLEKARDALMMSDKHLLSAENKMDDLTIKRLTRKNLTMAQKFKDIGN